MRASSRRRKRVLWNRSPSTSTTRWVPGKWTVPTVLRSFAARVAIRHPRLRRMSRRCWRRATSTRELRVSPSQCETAASDCAGGGDRTEPYARTSGEPYLCWTIALITTSSGESSCPRRRVLAPSGSPCTPASSVHARPLMAATSRADDDIVQSSGLTSGRKRPTTPSEVVLARAALHVTTTRWRHIRATDR